jgi:hypothetical protein
MEPDELNEIRAIINESGNSFHGRVATYFKERGWHTLISPYYMDGATDKPREIDLIVEKTWDCGNPGFFDKRYGTINVKLFIECKYIPQKVLFWFDKKNSLSAIDWVTSNIEHTKDNSYTYQNHYLCTNEKVAKLFASKAKQNAENEVMYKALNQSLNAMVSLRNRGSIIPHSGNGGIPILAKLEYPIILCNSFDNFYKVDLEGTSDPEKILDHFQLEVNYAYLDAQKNHRTQYFLIDVVNFKAIEEFLKILDRDVEMLSFALDF